MVMMMMIVILLYDDDVVVVVIIILISVSSFPLDDDVAHLGGWCSYTFWCRWVGMWVYSMCELVAMGTTPPPCAWVVCAV